MNQQPTYTLEQAINVLNNLTARGESFSIRFRKVEGGDTYIRRAGLRKMANTNKDKNGAYKLQFGNLETNEFKSCWIPLIKEVNNIQIDISNGS